MATVDMVTTAEVKTRLEVEGSARDTVIGTLITAASRAINNRCHRELTPRSTAVTRRIQVTSRLVDLIPYDLRAATSVIFDPDGQATTLAAHTDYELYPIGADANGSYTEIMLSRFLSLQTQKAVSFGRGDISVTGNWGIWDTANVPDDIKAACAMTVGAWLDKAVAQYGNQGAEFAIQPSLYSSLSIPRAAWSLLQEAGLPRLTT